jgi:hypothetical protein
LRTLRWLTLAARIEPATDGLQALRRRPCARTSDRRLHSKVKDAAGPSSSWRPVHGLTEDEMRGLTALLTLATALLGAPALADDHGRGHGDDDRHGWDHDGRDRDHDDHARPSGPPPAAYVPPPPPVVGPAPDHARPGWGTPGPRGVPPAFVEVRDDAGTDVDLYVDGAWLGPVTSGTTGSFRASAGRHTLTVRARVDGAILSDQRLDLLPGRSTFLPIAPPRVALQLANHGPAPLYVTVAGDARGFWLTPGTRQRVDVAVGVVPITTSVYGPRGLVPVDRHDVIVPYGARGLVQELGWAAGPPTTALTLTNHERTTVRVWIAGREVAVIPPGATRQVQVAAGRHPVVVTEDGGRVLWDAPATFAARGRYDVEIRHGFQVRDALALL